jgi:hypothetical protein
LPCGQSLEVFRVAGEFGLDPTAVVLEELSVARGWHAAQPGTDAGRDAQR